MKRYLSGSMLLLWACAPALAADGDSGAISAYLAKRQTVAAQDLAVQVSRAGGTVVYIAFVPGTSVLHPQSKAQIGEMARMLEEDEGLRIELTFQSSDRGTEDTPAKMAYERALSLQDALRELRIGEGRVVARSGTDPVAVAFNSLQRRM